MIGPRTYHKVCHLRDKHLIINFDMGTKSKKFSKYFG